MWRLALLALLAAPCAATPRTFTVLGRAVRFDPPALEVSGAPDRTPARFSDGTRKDLACTEAYRLDGRRWEPVALHDQLRANADNPLRVAQAEAPGPRTWRIRLDGELSGWQSVRALPLCVRAALADDLYAAYRPCAAALARRVRAARAAGRALPDFFDRLYYPPTAPVVAPAPRAAFAVALGIMVPAAAPAAARLCGAPADPVRKLYAAHDDPALPHAADPLLIVVHPSRDFHDPVTIARALEAHRARFRARGHPVALLFNDDELADALYFVRPRASEQVWFSTDGRHVLGRNACDVTLAGGFLGFCLGLTARSSIAAYFHDRPTGTLTIRLAAGAIFTEAPSAPGTTGVVTAHDELVRLGAVGFTRRHLGDFVATDAAAATRLIRPIREPLTAAEQTALAHASLADLTGRHHGDAFYPRLRPSAFRIRVVQGGADQIHPIGAPDAPRTVVFVLAD